MDTRPPVTAAAAVCTHTCASRYGLTSVLVPRFYEALVQLLMEKVEILC